jgi:hypothetical protein
MPGLEDLRQRAKYDSYRSKNRAGNMTIILPDGTSLTGNLSDNIGISYIGPSLVSQTLAYNKKGAFMFDVSLGYLSYKDVTTLNNNTLHITGGTFGLGLGAGYDILVSEKFGLGFGVSMMLGTLSRLTISNGYSSVSVKLEPEEYESLSRIDLHIGIRLY